MDRRDFIKKGALGASGVVAGGAAPNPLEGVERPKARVLPPEDMEAYLATVDEGVARLSEWPLAERFPGLKGSDFDGESLGRKALLSLYMAGMFGDLPVENQVHAGMQDRLWAAQPAMDEALTEMTDFVHLQTPEQLARVRATLLTQPDVLRDVITVVDAEAERSGVSEPRRAQLRAMFTDVGWRLENQPPGLIVDEYLGKVQKVTASDIEDAARQRWLTARYGEEIFWQAQESLRQRRISRGLKAMGIGALLFLAGLLLVSASEGDVTSDDNDALLWIGLVPGITVGSIFFVVGFIILLVGASTSEQAEDPGG
jgi:hypothetical protein